MDDMRQRKQQTALNGGAAFLLSAMISLSLQAEPVDTVPSASDTGPVTTYGEAINAALQTNPSVTSAFYEFEAAREAQRSAEGRLYPSVDLNGEYAWEERLTPVQDFGEYERDAIRFSVTQLLFDGFQTRDEARAFRYEKLARYYDVHLASQQTALLATEAYLDAVLYKNLVNFAEENYVFHRQTFNKIAERVEAGRDERVNLEQATARMALAESNLLTEVTNLHDTRAEFQRVVGRLPSENLALPKFPGSELPKLKDEALRLAYQSSPEVNTAIEELRSAKESLNASRGPFLPRLDVRYRNEREANTTGIRGDYELEAVELVLTYNLYRGGGDSARRRELSNRYYAAIEDRKEACLAIRREVTIAFNDVRALEQQVRYLAQQLDAQDKTRRAYGDQFDRNQRTLLDLLDSQNEYFDTQRALFSARADLVLAQASVLAEMGMLTAALDANGFNSDKLAEVDLELDGRDEDDIPVCPIDVVPEIEIDQESIFQRLNARADTSGESEPAVDTSGW